MSLLELSKKNGCNSLTELSERTGITKEYLSKLNTGSKSNPTREVMEKISTTLGVTLDAVNKSLKD